MKGNTVSIRANVTRDAEVRRTQGGSNAVKWGIAWNSSKKDPNGQWIDVPHYFDVECWMSDAQLNNVAHQIVKGAGCCVVDGHLEYQSWDDGNGNKRSKVVIRVDDPIKGLMLGAPRQAQNAQNGGYQPQPQEYAPQPQNAPQGAPQTPQGAYPAPQQGYGYQQQQPQGYGYAQQPQPQPQSQAAMQSSIYDEDIPF